MKSAASVGETIVFVVCPAAKQTVPRFFESVHLPARWHGYE